MSHGDIADRVEAYVRSQFRVAPGDTRFSRTVPLFESGYVDSIGLVELLSWLGAEFGVYLPDEALMSEDFSTIDGIARLIGRHVELASA